MNLTDVARREEITVGGRDMLALPLILSSSSPVGCGKFEMATEDLPPPSPPVLVRFPTLFFDSDAVLEDEDAGTGWCVGGGGLKTCQSVSN